jgi:hypothetical protein
MDGESHESSDGPAFSLSGSDEPHVVDQIPLSGRVYTPGFKTADDAGTDGDDTIHSKINFFKPPGYLLAEVPWHPHKQSTPQDDVVDVIFVEYMQTLLNNAAKDLKLPLTFTTSTPYKPGTTFSGLLIDWVKKNWECKVTKT